MANKGHSKKLGMKLKPIRDDIFIGVDRTHGQRSCISLLNPHLNLEIKPVKGKKGKDIFFKI